MWGRYGAKLNDTFSFTGCSEELSVSRETETSDADFRAHEKVPFTLFGVLEGIRWTQIKVGHYLAVRKLLLCVPVKRDSEDNSHTVNTNHSRSLPSHKTLFVYVSHFRIPLPTNLSLQVVFFFYKIALRHSGLQPGCRHDSKTQVSKSDKNNGYFTWRRFHMYDNISLNPS